jgi:hypothetical protein
MTSNGKSSNAKISRRRGEVEARMILMQRFSLTD